MELNDSEFFHGKFIDRIHQAAHKVEKLDEYGKLVFSYKGTQNHYEPQNIQLGPLGNVWISDLKYHRIQEFGPYGNLIGTFGSFGATAGKFDRPHGIAFKQELHELNTITRMYVVDTGNQRVQKFGLDLSSGWPTPGPTATPAARLEVLALSAQPAAFIAEDGQKTTISYLVTKPALVRVMVMDRFGSMIRDLGEQESKRAGELCYRTWDGRNNFGQVVLPDVYTVRTEATSGQEQAVATTLVIVLAQGQEPPTPIPTPTGVITPVWTPTPQPTPSPTWTATPQPTPTATPDLELDDCHAVPNPFRPDEGQVTHIKYTLNIDAQILIRIREKKTGRLVKTFGAFAPGGTHSHAGQNQVTWDGGEDDSDEVHAACHWRKYKYICTIRAEMAWQVEEKTLVIVKEIFK
ncbi:hypothetical protein K8S19_07460 [bacterium]|nr:hypothetical protein [bacterium]